jgi:very-short-patch-repair endonuclease
MGEVRWGPMPRPQRSTPFTRHTAIELRKDSSPAEARLWSYLRTDQLGAAFRRQHAIGPYIVDFCSPSCKLIIEVDGSQHLDQEEYDTERTAFLATKGYHVLRFWNTDVMNKINDVMALIQKALNR